MTNHRSPTPPLPPTTHPLPAGGSTDDRLVVVLRPVPDVLARTLLASGLVEVAADDTKVVFGPRLSPDSAVVTSEADAGSSGTKVLYTPVEAAAQLSVGRSTVYELLASGELESVRIGRCRRIPAASVTRYVDQLTSLSRAGGTIDPYRSSGLAQDAAVETGNTDGRVSMARGRYGTGGLR